MENSISYQKAIALFDYDSNSGLLMWKFAKSNHVKAGDIAGHKRKDGSLSVTIDKKEYKVAKIAWTLGHGDWPVRNIIHLDGDRANNSISNMQLIPSVASEVDAIQNIFLFKKLLSYDRNSGEFVWLISHGVNCAGDIAGHETNTGYIVICIFGKKFYAHRLAFAFMLGRFPIAEVDHIDGNRKNNKWTNLRDVERSTNAENKRSTQPNNKSSGLLGVHLHKRSGKFCASIKSKGVRKYIGLFDTKEEAHEAYLAEKRVLHDGCTI